MGTSGWRGKGRFASEAGVSLVEVMIAVLLLGTAFIALAQVATTGLFSLRAAADRTTAIGIATQAVESARAQPWEALGLDLTEHATLCGNSVAITQAGDVNETALCVPAGIEAELPFWGPDGMYEVETYITEIPGFVNARRATAIVRFQDQGQGREVRNSTVIAQVERG
jgi:Tfp pilus assembly protein PilV